MRLISRNLWINNHGQGWDDTCKVSPWLAIFQIGSGFNQISGLESPSTHSRLDCITHGCNSLPTSFSEMNQLIFHKKLIVCLWINNHFNYIPMWSLHHVVCCVLLFFVWFILRFVSDFPSSYFFWVSTDGSRNANNSRSRLSFNIFRIFDQGSQKREQF